MGGAILAVFYPHYIGFIGLNRNSMGVWDESNCRDESFIVETMNLPIGINDRPTMG